ncbi:MAG: glycosyltransferase [Verrucomicrobia bacterium]|nr:glycosyltransferase [Verrucomicrobiota bacterium]
MSDIHLCFCGDDHFAAHLRPLLWSVARHHGDVPIQLHFVHTGPAGSPFPSRVRETAARYGLRCASYELGSTLQQAIPTMLSHPWSAGLPRGTFGRWFLPDVLPGDVTRAIYTDTDVLFCGSLLPLWEVSLEGNPVGATRDLVACCADEVTYNQIFAPHLKEIGLAERRNEFFNAGVLVLDMEQWRRDKLKARLVAAYNRLAAKGVKLWLPDQDVLNMELQGRITPLAAGWNVITHEWLPDSCWENRELSAARICHFCGPKPWHGQCWAALPAPAARAYLEACRASSTADEEQRCWRIRETLYETLLDGGSPRLPYARCQALMAFAALCPADNRDWPGQGGDVLEWAARHAAPATTVSVARRCLATALMQNSRSTTRAGGRVTTSCIVSNYNYGSYVQQAVESALAQTLPFDEVIVVDDGSTDGSRELLQRLYGGHPAVRLVFKENGGQLSAFHAGIAAATGEILFFLDADDYYAPSRVEETVATFASQPDCEIIYCPVILFGRLNGFDFLRGGRSRQVVLPAMQGMESAFARAGQSMGLGRGRVEALVGREWKGAATSGIALKRELATRLLPLRDLESQWKVRADDCLVYGAAIADVPRYYLHRPLVHYRVHDGNAWFGQANHKSEVRAYNLAVRALTIQLCQRLGIDWRAAIETGMMQRCKEMWDSRQYGAFKTFRRSWRMPRQLKVSHSVRWRFRWKLIQHAWRMRVSSRLSSPSTTHIARIMA